MPSAKDYTGAVFGQLKCLKRAESRNGHTYWLCECLNCGTLKEIQTSHLTSGASKTCGSCIPKTPNFGGVGEEKKCILCGKTFISNNYKRQYCYDCNPGGLSPKDALRHKQQALKRFLIDYKGGKCERCGYDKCEAALQFHHKNPKEKLFSISQINLNATDVSIEIILKEVDKCSLLCANCHMEEHWLNKEFIVPDQDTSL